MAGMNSEIKEIQERYKILGCEEELAKALAALSSNKHLLVEGVAGVGKTIIAMALARHFNRSFFRIDGDERYTEHKLTGWFDPALVVAKGYSWETFIPGPLSQAMTEGSVLFINELNRLPEGTQNVLLPAMDEGQIVISKIGTLVAKPGFPDSLSTYKSWGICRDEPTQRSPSRPFCLASPRLPNRNRRKTR